MTQNNEREALLDKLLAEYWDIAYSEGNSGLWHGKKAQSTLNDIRKLFKTQSPISQNEQQTKQRVEALQADNLRLREALEGSKNVLEIAMTDRDGNKFVYLNTRSGSMLSALDTLDKCNKALSSTPTQSLAEHDNATIERIATALENAEGELKYLPEYVALVRGMKLTP